MSTEQIKARNSFSNQNWLFMYTATSLPLLDSVAHGSPFSHANAKG